VASRTKLPAESVVVLEQEDVARDSVLAQALLGLVQESSKMRSPALS